MSKSPVLPCYMRVAASQPDYGFVSLFDNVSQIPSVDIEGHSIGVLLKHVLSPSSEVMSKFKKEDFALTSLLEAGVPLTMMSLVMSNSRYIDGIENCVRKLDQLEDLSNKIEQSRSDFNAFISQPE